MKRCVTALTQGGVAGPSGSRGPCHQGQDTGPVLGTGIAQHPVQAPAGSQNSPHGRLHVVQEAGSR